MKKSIASILIFCFSIVALFAQENSNKTLSPYFFVKGTHLKEEALPLKSTSVEANIVGTIANVSVKQQYVNTGSKPIEAVYVFPASTRAAVYALSMRINNRLIEAEIREKKKAREEYNQAKKEGKRASLLEEERPNVFQMNVVNIMPGDTIFVDMKYTEMLIPIHGEYSFVFPTVVGPRYQSVANGKKESDKFVANPYLKQGEKAPFSFHFMMRIAAGMQIQNISSQTHAIQVEKENDWASYVYLDESEQNPANKDIIIKYDLRNDEMNSGLMLYNHGDEQFFLASIQPPSSVSKSEIPPREYVFIVDVSGSMIGFPMDVAKKLIKNLLANLKPSDKFNILLFSGDSQLLSETALPANKESMEKAFALLDQNHNGGGTELLPALERAFKLPHTDKKLSRSFVIVTDGYVSVEKEAFDLIRKNLNQANVFAFGIGSSVNRFLMEGLAHAGGGEPYVITTEKEVNTVAEAFRTYIQTPVLSHITLNFKGLDAYDVEPAVLPDMMTERPIVIFGKYKGKAQGEIVLKGYTGEEQKTISLNVGNSIPDDRNVALRYLWARERIRQIADFETIEENSKEAKALTNLGLTYNLLTQFTSFIAVDKEIVNKDGTQTIVKQALPMPENVSDMAVGFDVEIEGITKAATNSRFWFVIVGFLMIALLTIKAWLTY